MYLSFGVVIDLEDILFLLVDVGIHYVNVHVDQQVVHQVMAFILVLDQVLYQKVDFLRAIATVIVFLEKHNIFKQCFLAPSVYFLKDDIINEVALIVPQLFIQ